MEDRPLCLKKLLEEEYRSQHFGFTSQAFIDAVRGVITDNMNSSAETLSEKILEHLKGSRPEDVKAAADLLLKDYQANLNESLQTWQETIEKHFSIPSHVLLEEDEVQRQQYSAEEAAAVEEQLAGLVRRAKRAALLNSYLGSRLELVEKTKQRLEEWERRLGNEQATYELEQQASKLAECMQTFNNKAKNLGEAKLKHVERRGAAKRLRQRFQHLK